MAVYIVTHPHWFVSRTKFRKKRVVRHSQMYSLHNCVIFNKRGPLKIARSRSNRQRKVTRLSSFALSDEGIATGQKPEGTNLGCSAKCTQRRLCHKSRAFAELRKNLLCCYINTKKHLSRTAENCSGKRLLPPSFLPRNCSIISPFWLKYDRAGHLHGGQDDRWDAPVSPSTPPRKAQRNYTTALTIIVDLSAAGKDQNSLSGSDNHKNHRNRWSASSSCQDRAISIPRRYSLVNTNSSSRWYETLDLDDLPMQPTLRQPSMLLSSILSKSPATGSIASV